MQSFFSLVSREYKDFDIGLNFKVNLEFFFVFIRIEAFVCKDIMLYITLCVTLNSSEYMDRNTRYISLLCLTPLLVRR